jgi:hypothetical protein
MKHLMVVLMALLIPTAAMAKEGQCKDDKIKFCKDVMDAKGDVHACLKQHEADLSKGCKAQVEAPSKPK